MNFIPTRNGDLAFAGGEFEVHENEVSDIPFLIQTTGGYRNGYVSSRLETRTWRVRSRAVVAQNPQGRP